MNETTLIDDIQKKFGLLPTDAQEKVLVLLGSHIERAPKGSPGKDLLRFSGMIEKEDLDIMERAIEEECERIDSGEW